MMRLRDLPADVLRTGLGRGDVVLHLGPFATRLEIEDDAAIQFLADLYGECSVSIARDELSDFSLRLRPPNLFRRYFRRQIVPDPGFRFPAVPLPVSMSPLALEMGMNLCVALQCFRHVIFHAGVVADDQGALIISARSGGGKSTLTAALMEEGYRLLSDEFAILDTESTQLLGYPRPVSLKNASIDVVQGFAGCAEISTLLEGTPKGSIAYRRARKSDIERAHEPATPRAIIFPRFVADGLPMVTEIDLADAAMQLIASSPNYQIMGEAAFDALTCMLDGLRAFEISYGSTEDSLKLVADIRAGARAS